MIFKEVSEAYQVLSDTRKKNRYDSGQDLEDMQVQYKTCRLVSPQASPLIFTLPPPPLPLFLSHSLTQGMGGMDPSTLFSQMFGGGMGYGGGYGGGRGARSSYTFSGPGEYSFSF